jgi:hypothetical protein
MSNDVKVDFDADPNGNHHKLLLAYFEYLKFYERYCQNPSERGKLKCRAKLYQIKKTTVELRKDLAVVHENVKRLRQEVYENNKKQREIKKASKGN